MLSQRIRNRPWNDGGRKWRSFWLAWWVAAPIVAAVSSSAGPVFDTSTPINFFTNVASRLLSAELNVNWGQIEIYPTNQYTPSVHRLLQVTANIWDAQNTNFYPTVFRPLFSRDASNNIFICGYQQVKNVAGTMDPQLAAPYDPRQLQSATANPIADANGPVNVYGVPWVIGAKQGLPNFNQLSVVTAAQVTRKLELTRDTLDPKTADYATNQMYIMGISNTVGVSFWNSYSSAYPRPVTVYAWDTLSTTLTNCARTWSQVADLFTNTAVSAWPGAQWSGSPLNAQPQAASFLSVNWSYAFQSPLSYNMNTHMFDATGQWQATSPPLPELDQFGLAITNYLQAYILDGTNIIDYVQICSPVSTANLNQTLADPNYPSAANVYYQWSTNTSASFTPTPFGVINQLWVSGHPGNAPVTGGQWSTSPTPMGAVLPEAEAAYFNGFFTPEFQYNGQTYVNRDLEMQAPYTPSRTVYTSFLLQANDPLVHYLANDLNGQAGTLSIWSGKQLSINGNWGHSDDPSSAPLPVTPTTPVGGRYQPWGKVGQMAALGAGIADANAYNLAYKDPCVWGSDYWSFPTGQVWNVSWLGQVHRGTPWQTIYLKSTNILALTQFNGLGPNTWANWTGNLQGEFSDALGSAPVMDWQMVGLLAAMLNTNDLRTLLSVNNPDPNTWAAYLDGMTAVTNTLPTVYAGEALQLSPVVVSSNSAQAAIIASAIQTTKANMNLFPNQTFPAIGAVLATPQLSIQSPYLNVSTASQAEYGINDQAYEMIPSQLLPLLRLDSIGQMVSTNGAAQVQFSGYDGHQYAVQVSSDLVHWIGVSTNGPVNGVFGVAIRGGEESQFYRSVLIQ